jgi:hypothetical protein
MPNPASLLRWPVFLALAALHLAVLPFVLAEQEQVTVALAAGAGYLALAAADRLWRRDPA